MRPSIMMKKWVGIAMFAVGLCVVCVTGCRKSPEKIAEMTNLLFDAISSNDVEQAGLYIKSGANVNAKKGEDGITPLIFAIQKGRDEMVGLLIKSKADVNIKDVGNDGRSPLIWAIFSKNDGKRVIMADMLIKAKADLNAKDNRGYTALRHTASFGYIPEYASIMELLIKAGVDVNEKFDNGWTALRTAVTVGKNEGAVDMLIKAGADVNAKDDDGYTVLMEAACHASIESIDLLINAGADINARANNGTTALKEAIRYNEAFGVRKDVIVRLRAAGAK